MAVRVVRPVSWYDYQPMFNDFQWGRKIGSLSLFSIESINCKLITVQINDTVLCIIALIIESLR